jgi:hypothetical protein
LRTNFSPGFSDSFSAMGVFSTWGGNRPRHGHARDIMVNGVLRGAPRGPAA